MKRILIAMALAIATATTMSAHNGNSPDDCGIIFKTALSGVTKIEIESVDGNPLDKDGNTIITLESADKAGFATGKDYYIHTVPCNLYGGYRLSIFRNGLVAQYFGVHQNIEAGKFIRPDDLAESELKFEKPGTPLVEEGRPPMDSKTHSLFVRYRRNPSEENKLALINQMTVRYDKVVARKKNKLRELEREAKTHHIVEHMQGIVNEMVNNRDTRIQQQFLRFIDPRRDENPDDQWMVLRGASATNAYIGYTPVTNAGYACFKADHIFDADKEKFPVVNVSVNDAEAYCRWLSSRDKSHIYRLPTEDEWILGAGHMPKDVEMNSNNIETGLTAVDAYKQSTGACGGIDFWGNCWEWTTSTDTNGRHIIKGGSWDSKRDDCRSEKSDDARNGTDGYDNVGFRVVRIDRSQK